MIVPDWDQPFELMCDASDYAIGAVLGQRIEKHFRLIHYARKTMTEAELNCWELNTSELVLPRDELVLLSQQLVLLEENSSYNSRLQLPVLKQSVNTARITAVGVKVNAAESLLVVSTEVNAVSTKVNAN
ncbi:reverse transcriptase domain-containing protein [Tanacetum coccineum]